MNSVFEVVPLFRPIRILLKVDEPRLSVPTHWLLLGITLAELASNTITQLGAFLTVYFNT